MKMDNGNSWTLPQKIGIAAGLITIIGGSFSLYDWLANNSATLIWMGKTAWSGLTVNVKFWHLIAVGVTFVLGRYGWRHLRSERFKETEENAAVDLSGFETVDDNSSAVENNEERFEDVEVKGVLWDGTVADARVESLSDPRCPKCKTKLTTEFESTAGPYAPERVYESYCPNDTCTFSKDWMKSKYRDDVKKVIERRIRDGELEI